MKSFDKLWEEFKIQNPNTIGGFQEQYESFYWLWNKFSKRKVYSRNTLIKLMQFCASNESLSMSSSISKETAEFYVKIFLKEIES